ncbi:MAG: type IV pilus twitching motility protein PilT [Deferribacteraceae bacterium]|nr:type IV pilus twitching motility protein PilT [Deferribacteraceae bacterium]
MHNLTQILQRMKEMDASDVHITVGAPPMFRVRGDLVRFGEESFGPEETRALCYEVMNERQKKRLEEENEVDFSFGIRGISRFRANVFLQRGNIAAAFRMIPYNVRSCEQLGLPPVIQNLANRARGMVLVTGPTGSGKSTTLAALINKINEEQAGHIITIEDPIEYLHPHKKCIVNQRELNNDTGSFQRALKSILRQDPDVVLVGELRDPETIEIAMTVSETGHLTMGTLHTNSAIQTVTRIIDVFSPAQQAQVRTQLAFVLEGVISQQLVPSKQGDRRVLALEVLVPNTAIRNLIREDKVHQIYGLMQTGQGASGMFTMTQSLVDLFRRGIISAETALTYAVYPDEVARALGTR